MELKLNRSEKSTGVEKYPLPSTVDGIISLLREIMMKSVQRIEIDVNHPIRVVRNLEKDDPLLREAEVGLYGTLRQAEFIEYYSEGASPFQAVVDMMQLMHKEGRYPICWATGAGDGGLLSQWMEWKERGMPSGTEALLGLPVKKIGELPEDVLILCGSEYPSAEETEITLAVKVAIELSREPNELRTEPVRKVDDPVRVNPRKLTSAAGELALAAGGLRSTKWVPPDQH